MIQVCKHGLPISWHIGDAEWCEDHTLRQTISVRCCKQCVEEGTAAALAGEIKKMYERQIEERLRPHEQSAREENWK